MPMSVEQLILKLNELDRKIEEVFAYLKEINEATTSSPFRSNLLSVQELIPKMPKGLRSRDSIKKLVKQGVLTPSYRSGRPYFDPVKTNNQLKLYFFDQGVKHLP